VKVIMILGRSTGGIGTHVAQLSADLRDRGVDVVVVTHPLTAANFDLGPVRLWWPGSAGWVRTLCDFRALRRLAAASDIVHAHGHQGALLATLSTLGRRDSGQGPKLIVSQHNTVLEGSGRQGLKRLAQRWVAARANLVTGASSDLVTEALAFGAGRAELAEVPSPRVPELLAQPPAERAARARIRHGLLSSFALDPEDLDVPLVVTISRIAPQKNLPVLVQAASRLRQACIWVVLGEGDPQLLAQLRVQARALGAPVHFVGACSDADQWLRGAEVFVLVSQWEARALVVQEAMAAGTPVVATDVGGLHDLVAGTGLLVPPGDSEAIAKATGRVLAVPGLREELAARGREVAGALPDGRDTASRWLAWYAQTLAMT
jgi:glycosyltransferase involved in cell wall biosynthesis